MIESTTITVGLDVHARSIRLDAVRAEELLEEPTLPYDEEAVARLLLQWPAVRCCYEAGPTGFGLYRFLVERGIECAAIAPGLVQQRPGDRVKTDPRDARRLARLHAGGLLEPIHVPPPEVEAARDLVRALGSTGGATVTGSRSSACATADYCPPPAGRSCNANGWASSASSSRPNRSPSGTYLHTADLVDARIEQLERAIREQAEHGPWREGLGARVRGRRQAGTPGPRSRTLDGGERALRIRPGRG
jgi:transposase